MKKIAMVLFISLLLAGCGIDTQDSGRQDKIEREDTASVENTNSTEIETAPDSVLKWDEKSVVIPEVNREYEIWFLADSHIIIPDENASEKVQAYTAERLPVFTNEKGVESSQILTEFIELANEQKPDMVLLGGDILDFPSEANVAFFKEELDKLTIPYIYVMGNHDWTFPWEYMTQEGTALYRPLYEEVIYGNFSQVNITGDSYSCVVELEDLVILAVDDSSNQVAAEAAENIEYACSLEKPVVLMQHVPFSTEKLIAEAKNYWANPVTLGMQIHGGLAPNEVSADLYRKVLDDESMIRVVLAGHVHFAYEERISAQTVEIITDAAFKGNAVKLHVVLE